MNRHDKALMVDSLKHQFEQNDGAFLIGFKGLSVPQMQKLRRELNKAGASLKITKARLMKLAAQELPEVQGLMPYFKDQIGVVFASKDVATVAKALSEFAKGNEALSIIVAALENRVLDKAAVVRIANLPPRQVLLAQLCGTLQAPITGLTVVLNQTMLKLLLALKAVADKKQQ